MNIFNTWGKHVSNTRDQGYTSTGGGIHSLQYILGTAVTPGTFYRGIHIFYMQNSSPCDLYTWLAISSYY